MSPLGNIKTLILFRKKTDAGITSSYAYHHFQGDFTTCLAYVSDSTFVYIDPPYRPLNKTSSFTGYSQEGFSEQDQIRLFDFFRAVDKAGSKVMLSNSDPRNENPDDHFFDDLYQDYVIERVLAKRFINSKGDKRGAINELIIRNYQE
jgi:DNA adenine methylase